MADKSSIEWTDATWNPVTGCSRVSAGCENCYAERLAATRMKGHPSRQGLTDHNGRWTGGVRFNPGWLDQPIRWSKPRRIFVCAHSDLFHENVDTEWIDKIFAVMAMCPEHVFQVLTKRPQRMRDYIVQFDGDEAMERVIRQAEIIAGSKGMDIVSDATMVALPHVWLGVSAEDQQTADERIPILLGTPAAVRWLSAEPLLGPIALDCLSPERLAPTRVDALRGRRFYDRSEMDCPSLDWVVLGGESGPGYRPMEPRWARSIELHCRYSGVAFFMKQMAGKREIPADLMVQQMPRGRA